MRYKSLPSLKESIDVTCIDNDTLIFESLVNIQKNIHFYMHVYVYKIIILNQLTSGKQTSIFSSITTQLRS